MIGSVNVKSSPVYFHAQKSKSHTAGNTIVPFEILRFFLFLTLNSSQLLFKFSYSYCSCGRIMFSNLNVHLTEIFNIGLGNTKNLSIQLSTAIFPKPIMIQVYYAKKKEIICAIILIDSRCQSCPSLNVKKTSHKWEYQSILGEHGECSFKVPRLESVKWIKSKSPKVQRRCQKPRRVK